MSSSFFHILVCTNNVPLCGYYYLLFVHSTAVSGHWGFVHLFVIMGQATMNICVLVFGWTYVLISLGCMLRSDLARQNDKPTFKFLRICQAFFQSGCTILYFHQQCMQIPGTPYPNSWCALLFSLNIISQMQFHDHMVSFLMSTQCSKSASLTFLKY